MSHRATHAILLETSAGHFQTIDQVYKMINNLLPWLHRKSEKAGYSYVCYAGASMWHSGAGNICYGKQGKKEFVVLAKNSNGLTDPHMHIILLGNPADALAKLIVSYLKDKGIRTWYDECDNRVVTNIPYVTSQSIKSRTSSYNIEALPEDALAEFIKIAEYYNKLSGGCLPVFKGLSEPYHAQELRDLSHFRKEVFINMDKKQVQKA